jgi:hypothetical protein
MTIAPLKKKKIGSTVATENAETLARHLKFRISGRDSEREKLIL